MENKVKRTDHLARLYKANWETNGKEIATVEEYNCQIIHRFEYSELRNNTQQEMAV